MGNRHVLQCSGAIDGVFALDSFLNLEASLVKAKSLPVIALTVVNWTDVVQCCGAIDGVFALDSFLNLEASLVKAKSLPVIALTVVN